MLEVIKYILYRIMIYIYIMYVYHESSYTLYEVTTQAHISELGHCLSLSARSEPLCLKMGES